MRVVHLSGGAELARHVERHARTRRADALSSGPTAGFDGEPFPSIHFKYPFPSSFASPNSNSFRFAWRHGAAYLADSGAAT